MSTTDGTAGSEELIAPLGPDLELCYQTFGSPDDEPLLLVMGLGGPMTWWPRELCERLADRGFYVVRYDNRDTGRSSRMDQRVRRSHLVRAFLGAAGSPPYSLTDLAGDAVGLLDHLGISSAHVAGVSMGGMIAQTVALEHPDRVRSLTSIMSTTGRRTVGWQHPALLPSLLWSRGEREGYIESSEKLWRIIGSPDYPTSAQELRDRAGETFDRGMSRMGVMRQMLAILGQPDRTDALGALTVPTAVVHGRADKMVHVSGGRATATAIPGAELVLVRGMGHDLPAGLYETFVATIRRTADRARRTVGAETP
ncbi:alpha/beta fold hydrolase [Nocardioides panacisoli]|uniref:alpha/beta fold hydrolase n=1 Tax=Nocardioides panacisoli TaxID=627624 RepID=UPI001C63163D|nr:alpha/beta fold hydrolase [Nocardioides panacisoli]QYJ02611.1 alpha/beta fold hydrolase [Nocardioides panacisoli]